MKKYIVDEQSAFDWSSVETYLNRKSLEGFTLVTQYYQFPNITAWVFFKEE